MNVLPAITFPSLIGHHFVTTLPLPPSTAIAYQYLVAANGIFLRAENPYLSVIIPVHTFTTSLIRGLEPLTPSVSVHHPRLPETLLTATLADACTHTDATAHLIEVLYFFLLHADTDGTTTFSVMKPPQTAGVAHVHHLHTPEADPDPILLELHTHGTMSAFWSGTDNRDEQGFCFYAVVGHLDHDHPSIRLRLGVYGHFWEVPLSTLFHIPEESVLLHTPPTPLQLEDYPNERIL